MSQRLYGICRVTMPWQLLKISQRTQTALTVITSLVAMFCLPISVSAGDKPDIYSWRDAAGVLHFADRPADSYPSKLINPPRPFGVITSEPPDAETATDKQPVTTQLETEQSASKKPVAPVLRVEEQPDYARNCENARDSLLQLNRFKRIRVKNSSGQDVFLTRSERQSLIDAAQQSIQSNCLKI